MRPGCAPARWWPNGSPAPPGEPLAHRPDVVGARITAWLGHYDFFAATADDAFRQKLMARLVSDARSLSAALPAEELDARALTALKGLIAAAVALPEHAGFLTRALRFLPQEIARQVLPDGCHAERSPAAQLAALQDLTEIRALLQAAQTQPPPALTGAIERMAPALRVMRHGDGGLALFNGSREESSSLIDIALTQAGRERPRSLGADGWRLPAAAGRPQRADRRLRRAAAAGRRPLRACRHALDGAVGRARPHDRQLRRVPGGSPEWRDATRATAAHSTLVIADVSSSELKPDGLGRRPVLVEAQRQEANGAHWLEASHDGWKKLFGAVHRRRLYLAESGEDVRGEDAVEAPTPQPFTLRFHLHPDVNASLQQDGEAVLLRLRSGGGWRLRADGARMSLEESIYLGGHGAPPQRAGGADRLCRRPAAGEMGDQQGRLMQ